MSKKKKTSSQVDDLKTAVDLPDLKPAKNPKGGISTKYTTVKWEGPDLDAAVNKNR